MYGMFGWEMGGSGGRIQIMRALCVSHSFGKLMDLLKEFERDGNIIRSTWQHLREGIGVQEAIATIEVKDEILN